jgi:hypothetical protein
MCIPMSIDMVLALVLLDLFFLHCCFFLIMKFSFLAFYIHATSTKNFPVSKLTITYFFMYTKKEVSRSLILLLNFLFVSSLKFLSLFIDLCLVDLSVFC